MIEVVAPIVTIEAIVIAIVIATAVTIVKDFVIGMKVGTAAEMNAVVEVAAQQTHV